MNNMRCINEKNNSSKQMIIGIIIAIIIVFLVSVSVMQRDKKMKVVRFNRQEMI